MKTTTLFAVLMLSAGLAESAKAEDYEVRRALHVSAPMSDVWHVVGDFCDVDDWHPDLSDCALRVIDGQLHRVLITTDGSEFVERRIAVEAGLSYTYRIVASPLPVERYTATLAIAPDEGALISWSARFSSEDPAMEAVVGSIFEAGLSAIANRFEEE